MHPSNCRSYWVAALIGVLWTIGSAAQDKAAGAGEQKRVMRFVGFYYDSHGWVVVTPPAGGPALRLMMTDECRSNARGPGPASRLVWVTARPGAKGIEMATAVAPFDRPNQLEAPSAYQFDGLGEDKVGAVKITVVKLSKFGESSTLPLANKPGPGGKPAPDPALLKKLEAFNPGDVVEVEVQTSGRKLTLLDVDKYRAPRVAEFVKSGPIPGSGGKRVPGVTLRGEDGDVQYSIPAAGPRAVALNALVRRLKPGALVRFTARDEDKPPVLRDLRFDVEVRPTADGQLDIVAPFCRVSLSSHSTSTYCYVYAESNRPGDKALIAGCRRLTLDANEQMRVKLSRAEAQRMKAVLEPQIDPEDRRMTPRELSEFQQLYRAWLQSEGEPERARLEEQMIAGAMELSNRFRKDADLRIVTLKGMLSPEQLAAAKKLGERD